MGTPSWVRRAGRTLEKMMRAKGWSQDDLARRTPYTQKTISNLIKGAVESRPKTVIAAYAAFGQEGVEALRELGLDGWADQAAQMLEQRFDSRLEEFMSEYGDDLKRRLADES